MGVDDIQRPYVERSPMGGIRLYLTYHPSFVDWLKQTVPIFSRKWDEDTKSWYVGSQYADEVLAHARMSFAGLRVEGAARDNDPRGQWQRAQEAFERQNARERTRRMGGQQRYQAPPPPIFRTVTSSSDHAQLCVTDDAPPEVVRAAYKALAMLYHPDKPAGSTERMQKINAAFGRLKERGKA